MRHEKAVFICLFGGPGTGKSTTAAGLFSKLKIKGYNAELIQEYAKDKVWAEDFHTLSFQPYILGKQLYRQYRVADKVDVAVTDSPVLFSHIYQGFGWVEGSDEVLLKQFNLFRNLNIFLERDTDHHPYNPKGRMQTEEDAKQFDTKILSMLDKFEVPYTKIKVSDKTVDEIYDLFTKAEELCF